MDQRLLRRSGMSSFLSRSSEAIDGELPPEDDDDHPGGGELDMDQRDEGRRDESFVRDRIEELTHRRDLAPPRAIQPSRKWRRRSRR